MRILHVAQPTDGGTAVVVRELARFGVQRGHEVMVACPDEGFLAQWARENGVSWIGLPLTRHPSVGDLRAIGRVRRLAAGADVLHLHSSMAGVVGRLAALTMRVSRPRVVFTAHGWSWYVGGRSAGLYQRVERALTPMADATAVVSDQEMADGRAVLGPRAQLHLVPNGVSLTDFSPDGPLAARTSSPLVVQVGRLSRQKGQDRSIRALGALGAMGRRDVVLRLVGDGDDRAALAALAKEHGVGDRVEFVAGTDPRPHVRAADVVLLPARWEGMPLALLEAMAMGKAIVTTDVGGSEALGEAGCVVSEGSEEEIIGSLAREVALILDDGPRRSELGQRARQRCEGHYDLDETMRAYERLWSPGR